MQLKKASDILGSNGVRILMNSKMKYLCDYMGIDIYNCDSYKNGRAFSRYFKHIIQDPHHGYYTYKLWEKRFGCGSDNVMANEWSNNMMDMCGFNNTKCAIGTAIWFALSLAAELYKIVDSATVDFCFNDVNDKDNEYYEKNDYHDCPHVTFYVNRLGLPEITDFNIDEIEDTVTCRMLIRIDK